LRYEDISDYVQTLVGPGDELQSWVRHHSDELRDHGVFAIDPTRGRFLEVVARLKSPSRVLEVGSGAGYSALWFMKGMGSKGSLDGIEIDPVVAKELEAVMRKAGLKRRVKIHIGPALTTLRRLKGPYDLIFIDADKDEYPRYLEHALRLTKPGAVILADNMLWSGATFLRNVRKEGATGIIEYTKRIFNDTRLSSLIVPLGDGIAISTRIK
jgi:predicted O-methyltransferase YrrM